MTRPTDHYDSADIIKRLEAAYGPDRELDFVVALTLGFTKSEVDPIGEAPTVEVWISPDRVCSYERLPEFTASLDAVVALQERVLPGWGRQTIISEDGTADVQLCPPNGAPGPGPAEHKSEPIALLIALFKALEAKDG